MNNPKPDFVGSASRRRWAGVTEAADYAACGRTKLWQLMQRGSIFAVHSGGKVVISLDSIDAYYERCEPVAKRPLDLAELSMSAMDLGIALDDSGKPAHEFTALPKDKPPGDAGTRHEPALADVESLNGASHE